MNGQWCSFRNQQALVIWTLVDPTGLFKVVHIADKGSFNTPVAFKRAVQAQLQEARNAVPGLDPGFAFMFGAPGGEEGIINSVHNVLGDALPILGGSSGDNMVSGKWQQLSVGAAAATASGGAPRGAVVTTDGLVVVVAWSKCKIVTSLTSGFSETEHSGVVTKIGATRRDILEIDGRPAADVYNEWDGGHIRSAATFGADGKANVLSSSSFTPLGEPIGDGSHHRVLHPAFVDTVSGGISLFADVHQGCRLTMLRATAETLIDAIPASALQLIRSDSASTASRRSNSGPGHGRCIGAMMVFCGGLVMAIDDDMPLVCEKLSTMVGYRDHMGICCFGEQGKMLAGGASSTAHGNLMFGCMLFYEPDPWG